MEDLKTILDNNVSIVDINDKVNKFIDSAKDYDDKLKLTFVALNLLKEGVNLLNSVGHDDFIKQVKEKIDKAEKEHQTLSVLYGVNLKQNDEISALFTGEYDNRISSIQKKIPELLSEYDRIIRELVETRDKLPIEKQLEKEK